MKSILPFLFAITIFLLSNSSIAQTNVSGGIYSNTIWTLANSPYIVTDTIVVFPNVTLTIEPGVEVRFENDKLIVIRFASIIAIGTPTDSITFTSNSATPGPSSWKHILLQQGNNSKFDYCNFRYAEYGITNYNFQDLTTVRHSRFENNKTGLYGDSYTVHCLVDSCVFRNNHTGIDFNDYITISNSIISQNFQGINLVDKSSILNCLIDSNSSLGVFTYSDVNITNNRIRKNGTGLEIGTSSEPPNIITGNIIEDNSVGIKLHWNTDQISCNKICNNSTYNIQNDVALNQNVAHNFWCSNDSTIISSGIYDGYDNLNLGLVNFIPIDTVGCYLFTDIPQNPTGKNLWSVYPNPASSFIIFNSEIDCEIKFYNLTSECVRKEILTAGEHSINISNFLNGVYIVEVGKDGVKSRKVFVKM